MFYEKLSLSKKINTCQLRFFNIDLYAYSLLQKLAEVLKVKELYHYERYLLYKMLLQPYKRKNCPTVYYLQQLPFVYEKEISALEKQSSFLSLEERLELGFTLSEEEYLSVKEEYKRMKNRLF